MSGALRMTPCVPRRRDAIQRLDQSPGGPVSRKWKRARMTAGRSSGSSASSAARTAAENRVRRLHDDVDEERAAGQPDLVALPFQVGDGPRTSRAVLSRTPVRLLQHAVDRGLAQAGLHGDLADPEWVGGPSAALRPGLMGF